MKHCTHVFVQIIFKANKKDIFPSSSHHIASHRLKEISKSKQQREEEKNHSRKGQLPNNQMK